MYRSKAWMNALIVGFLLLAIAPHAHAADISWRRPEGGTFSSAGSWFGGVVPGGGDNAIFGLSTSGPLGTLPPYTVSFTALASNSSLRIQDDSVVFDLNGLIYETLNPSFGMVLGMVSGKTGQLTVTDGIVTLPFQSDLEIASVAGAGGALVVGAGGKVIGTMDVLVGLNGNGALNIHSNGDVIANDVTLGSSSTVTGTATITGAGSSLLAGTLVVGSGGTGGLNVNANGRVDSATGVIGDLVGSIGNVNVDGVNSQWNLSSGLVIGRSGTGSLSITGGGTVQSGSVLIAHRDLIGNPGTGAATVSGLNSQWIISGNLSVGINGVGTLDIDNGGLVQSASGEIGALGSGAAGSGIVHVAGATSRWINSGELFVGATHMGALLIMGGQVQNSNGVVGAYESLGPGAVTVHGANSQWINLGDATIGRHDIGTLDITAGGRVESVNGFIGSEQHGEGRVTIDGANGVSSWINSGTVAVGILGKKATLEIKNGGQVQSATGAVGSGSGTIQTSVVVVDGSNGEGFDSQWVMSGDLRVNSVTGDLTISNGGRVENFNGTYGKSVTITGSNSRWINLGNLTADNTSGTLNVINAGRVECVNGSVSGVVNITGPGSRWINSGTLGVGDIFPGTLNISGGGVVKNTNGSIASSQNQGSGFVNVDGNGSQWINSGTLTIGGLQTGFVNITGGGRVQSVDGRVGIGSFNADAAATIEGGGSSWNMSGRLSLAEGRLDIRPGGTVSVAGDTTLRLSSALNLQGGTFSTTEIQIQSFGGGSFNWTSGTLHIGLFHNILTVPNGGTLAPGNSVGSTTIDGDYVQQSGGALEIELGGVGSADFVNVTGVAQLGGNLQLKFLIGFIPPPSTNFVVFDSRGITGAFSNIANGQRLATVDGLGSFVVNYGAGSAFDPTQIVLSSFLATIGVPGDYNNNGVVDAADYVLWRNGGPLANDNTPGVQPGDYDVWRANFGQTVGSGSGSVATAGLPISAVPEPTSSVPLLIACLPFFRLCRRSI